MHHGFAHGAVALSAGVQRMVRADIGASGVIFTLDTESGFPDVCMVTAAWGLGETVVQGSVNPDEWLVFKPVLADEHHYAPIVRRSLGSKAVKRVYRTRDVSAASADATVDKPVEPSARGVYCLDDADVLQLARFAVTIEEHYSAAAGEWRPMDIEFAKDGATGQLFIVQARPETVHSARKRRGAVLESYSISSAERRNARVLATGRAVGAMIGAGRTRVIVDASRMSELQEGEVLVTDMTDPDWEPVLKRAAAIVTNRGGRTCHAAIVAREVGIPAVVGAAEATSALHDGTDVTVSCAEGEAGVVLDGIIPFEKKVTDATTLKLPRRTQVSLILGNPDQALSLSTMPVHGVGLARLEFIVSRIGVHPRACLDYDSMPASSELKKRIADACRGAPSPAEHYVRGIAEGVATIAAAFYPQPVIVRLSDFKTNEYRQLLGGEAYEPQEENPMLGFRGASRYYAPSFEAAFGLECAAMARARDVLGLRNIELMLPFVRTEAELQRVIELMERHGLRRGDDADATPKAVADAAHGSGGGLAIHVMCEIPANALLADRFLRHVGALPALWISRAARLRADASTLFITLLQTASALAATTSRSSRWAWTATRGCSPASMSAMMRSRCSWAPPSTPPTARASTSASAGRRPATFRSWRRGWCGAASAPCRSTRTAWWARCRPSPRRRRKPRQKQQSRGESREHWGAGQSVSSQRTGQNEATRACNDTAAAFTPPAPSAASARQRPGRAPRHKSGNIVS